MVLTAVTALPALQGASVPNIAVMIDPPSGEVGLVMDVTLSVSGEDSADCELQGIPEVEGGRLRMVQPASHSQSTVIVGGRVTRTLRTEWRFQFVPEQVGTLTIPPFRFDCRGSEASSRPIEIPVQASTLRSDAVDLQLFVSADDLWVGQIFNVDVRASIDEEYADKLVQGGLELDLPWLDGLPGMLRMDQAPPVGGQPIQILLAGRREPLEVRAARDNSGERPRIVFSRSLQMIATQAGEIALPESRFSVTIATEVRRDRDPFGSFFNGGDRMVVTRAATVDARAPGTSLVVRGPPDEGRPRGFTNAVGRFRFSGTAKPTTLDVGDTCTITLSLSGEGNLEFVEWPAFDELAAGFRVFGKEERKSSAVRTLELSVAPRNDRVTEIPALEFAAFDPDQGVYEVLRAGPFTLDVRRGGPNEGLVALEDPTETLNSLETIRESLPAPGGEPWPAWWLVLPGALALLFVETRMRRAAWREQNPHMVARRGARRALDQALAGAKDAHDVASAFAKFLSARLDGPPAGLGAEEAAERISDTALGDELRRTVSAWEAAYLGGAELDVAAARAQAEALASKVEAAT
jgi:hypothetical protein